MAYHMQPDLLLDTMNRNTTMQELMNISATQTMTSLEVAKLTKKTHGDVLKDIDSLSKFYTTTYSKEKSLELCKTSSYKDSSGKSNRMFELSKDASLDLVTGYSLPHRHAVNQRWQELETKQQPKSFGEALLLCANLQLDIEKREAQALLDAPLIEYARVVQEMNNVHYIRDWVKSMKSEHGLHVGEHKIWDWLVANEYVFVERSTGRKYPYAKYEYNGKYPYFQVNKEMNGNMEYEVVMITSLGKLELTKVVLEAFK